MPFALLATLAGCAAAEGPRLPDPDSCGAAEIADLLGEDATRLERRLLLRPVRMVRPGDPPPETGFPARLNIVVDGEGRIARLVCG